MNNLLRVSKESQKFICQEHFQDPLRYNLLLKAIQPADGDQLSEIQYQNNDNVRPSNVYTESSETEREDSNLNSTLNKLEVRGSFMCAEVDSGFIDLPD